jgi:hypothetical protein
MRMDYPHVFALAVRGAETISRYLRDMAAGAGAGR